MSSNYSPPPAAPQIPESRVAFEHAQRMSTPATPPDGYNGNPVLLVPSGWKLENAPGWQVMNPDRIRTTVEHHTVESFCRYVMEHKNDETRIFGNLTDKGATFTAVFDYHSTSKDGALPGWSQHIARFTPAETEDWKRWQGIDKKPMSQAQFARFLEDNTVNITEPSGADLLQLVNTIEIEGKVAFESAQRLESGSISVRYVNEQKAKSGTMEFPSQFRLVIPIFEDEPCMPMLARLRYRLANSEFSMWLEFVNPHAAIRSCLANVFSRISTGTAITPFRSLPPVVVN